MIFKRIRDAGYSDAISWVYAALLVFNIMMAVDRARLGLLGGDGTGIIGLILGGISLFAYFVKTVPRIDTPASRPTGSRNPESSDDSDNSAEAIIARAVEARRLTQQSQQVTQPTPARSSTPVSFGNRVRPSFGTR
jgi:hypothetical protein